YHFAEFDVSAAFLEGKNDYINYARLPVLLGGLRLKVIGNFYGEKKGPKIWNDHFNKIVLDYGFERCPVHPCLYRYESIDGVIIFTVHVDDGLVITNNNDLVRNFESYFKTRVLSVTFQYQVGRYIGIDLLYNQEKKQMKLTHEL